MIIVETKTEIVSAINPRDVGLMEIRIKKDKNTNKEYYSLHVCIKHMSDNNEFCFNFNTRYELKKVFEEINSYMV